MSALLHAARRHPLHLGELLGRGLHVAEPQHHAAHRGRAEECAQVDRAARFADLLKVAGEVGPVRAQLEAIEERLQLGEERLVQRRRRDTLSGNLGGDALPDLRFDAIVDQHVQLRLAEQVDEPGRDHPLADVDPADGTRAREVAHRRDPVALDPHVGAEPGRAGPVDHPAVGEHQVVIAPRARRRYRSGRAEGEKCAGTERDDFPHARILHE